MVMVMGIKRGLSRETSEQKEAIVFRTVVKIVRSVFFSTGFSFRHVPQ